MSKNTSIVIGREQQVFIQAQIKKSRFGSAREAMRAGIRLLEEQELKVEALRAAKPHDCSELKPQAKSDLDDIWTYTSPHRDIREGYFKPDYDDNAFN